jgi:hypothetical protein
MFDNYTLKARFYPVIILIFPIIILGVFYSFQFQTVIHFISSLGLVGALTFLLSQLGRDQGKLKENKLWKSWGAPPTTKILRLKDSHIDRITKTRYHQKLQSLCPVSIMPNLLMEETTPIEADEIYKAWTKYLISKTRDTIKFNLLFKDNISYGFRRNLWGLKTYAVIFNLFLLIGNYFFWTIQTKNYNPQLFPVNFMYVSIILIIIILFWILIVTESWVKIPALSYSERLCEATEVL